LKIIIHKQYEDLIAELQLEGFKIKTVQDALDLMADSGSLGARKIIIKKEQLCPEFFDLHTGIAGEILQKFSTYRMHLAIVGDFSVYKSKSLNDFIYESNKMGKILFVSTIDQAIERLSKSS
jgi:hypothetical protein